MKRRTIEKAVGDERLTLEAGEGYFYFIFDDGDFYDTESVLVYRLNHLRLDQWTAIASDFISRSEEKSRSMRDSHVRGRLITMRRRNPALPSGFEGFDIDDDDDDVVRLTDTLQRGDVLRIGTTRWVVVRAPRGSVAVSLYKFPSRQRKMYKGYIGQGSVEIFEINGMGDHTAKVLDASESDILVEKGVGRDQLGY